MSCVCVDSGISKFPSMLGCVITNGFEITVLKKKRYLANKSEVNDNPRVKAKVLIPQEGDIAIFATWWIEELNYGHNNFTINIPFFGILRDWNVRLKNDLTETISAESGELREIDILMEVVDENFAQLIEEGASDIICNICGE